MLGEGRVTATIAVKDLAVAKQFYGDTLGLKLLDESPAGLWYESGDSKVLVYPSAFAGTNKATYAGWKVADVDAAVAELKSKGVQFEKFDMPDTTWEGDVAVWGPMRSAWFKDLDGNILAVGNM